MQRDLITPTNTKKPRVIDPLDYDFTLDIHGDPIRNPPTPYDYKNDNGEYDIYHEAYWIAGGIMKKDSPRDYSSYMKMWNEYTQTNTYKRQRAAAEHYKERLKKCKTKEDFMQAYIEGTRSAV